MFESESALAFTCVFVAASTGDDIAAMATIATTMEAMPFPFRDPFSTISIGATRLCGAIHPPTLPTRLAEPYSSTPQAFVGVELKLAFLGVTLDTDDRAGFAYGEVPGTRVGNLALVPPPMGAIATST
jgi:hypothetical protein